MLEYLLPKYELHIISNGWQDIQVNKMKSSEIHHYFGEIITNELAGTRKPDRRIFDYAVEVTKADLAESLMIGDNYEADILGAINANMDVSAILNGSDSPEQKLFDEIVRTDGLKAALAWRDARFEESLITKSGENK